MTKPAKKEPFPGLRFFLMWCRTAYATSAICLGLIVVFVRQCLLEWPRALWSPELSVLRAGFVRHIAVNGEWWRFFTGPFLHGGAKHLMFNLFTMLLFGGMVESAAGHAALPGIVLLCALGGSSATYLVAHSQVSVGISGAGMGLMGFLLASSLKKRELTAGLTTWIAVNIGMNLFMGLIAYKVIDNAAHLGGLLTGALLGVVVPSIPPVAGTSRMRRATSPVVTVMGLASALVLATTVVLALIKIGT